MKKYPEKRDLGESLLSVVSEAPSREKTAACRAPLCVAGLISLAPPSLPRERGYSRWLLPPWSSQAKLFFWGRAGGEGRSLLPTPRADTVAARPGLFAAGLLAAVRRQSRPRAASAAQRGAELIVWGPGHRAPQAALCSLASQGPKIWLPRFLLGGKPQSLPNFRRKKLSERDLAWKGEC